jgi:FixJ family two-component response regulator
VSGEMPFVFVVDDDASVRRALARRMRVAGFGVEEFASAQEFLERGRPGELGCLVLDVRMPGLDGLGLQDALAAAGMDIPIVFLTGHGSVPLSVQAMKGGAVDFLEKPVSSQTLLDAVRNAIELHRRLRQEAAESGDARERLAALTLREREILELVVAGLLNKQIALRLGIAERTVKLHRAHAMEKLGARTTADLVRSAAQAGLTVSSAPRAGDQNPAGPAA